MNSKLTLPFQVASQEKLAELGISKIDYLDQSRLHSLPAMRLEQAKKAALAFREKMLTDDQHVVFYRSIDLIRAPYPTKYGLLNANKSLSPFIHILNRLFVIQYKTSAGIKTLLFSPSDIDANVETPFYKRLTTMAGPLSPLVNAFLAPIENRVEDALKLCGIAPEDVDYISYDHLHTQDIRKWLGAEGAKGYFPNAKLLVMKKEWDSTTGLLPQQQEWYCPDGIQGVANDRVILLDGSVKLGQGIALVHTPGHTEGNHSLVAYTDEGLLVSSENGISSDSYSPLESKIPGVREYAKETGMEVILNGNTLENSIDQYISMVMEKTIAGPSKRNPAFYNCVPSSDLTHYWGFPGLRPTFSFGPLSFGEAVTEK